MELIRDTAYFGLPGQLDLQYIGSCQYVVPMCNQTTGLALISRQSAELKTNTDPFT